jgi:uncharacterized membrane protein YhaH (DUF805 family)
VEKHLKLQWRLTGWSACGLALLLVDLAVLWITGCAIEWAQHEGWGPEWLDLTGEIRPWVILHGGAAWALPLLGGRYVWAHLALCAQRAHALGRRASGWMTLLILVMLTLTGLGLMYGSADHHERLAALHFGIGIPVLGVLSWHVLKRHCAHRKG